MGADVVISLPKLKTHELTLYTGGVKNMFGIIPLKPRRQAHILGKKELFSEAVVDIYSTRIPHLCVMDGVVGMEGSGPSKGSVVKAGVILASRDCVNLDVIASLIIGLDPLDVPVTRAALQRGFGDEHPDVVGDEIDSVIQSFRLPGTTLVGSVPPFIVKKLGGLFVIRPSIDQDRCIHCGACVRNCSPDAIHEEDGHLVVDDSRCILCYCCRELCPEDAVEMKSSLFAKVLSKIRNRR